jgi:hypothetical protein
MPEILDWYGNIVDDEMIPDYWDYDLEKLGIMLHLISLSHFINHQFTKTNTKQDIKLSIISRNLTFFGHNVDPYYNHSTIGTIGLYEKILQLCVRYNHYA